MPIYVHVTDDCADEANRHGQSSFIESVQHGVETTQSLTGFDYFLPTPFVKKSLGRSFRLIAYRVPIGNDELILFLRVLARGGKEYEYFLKNWDRNTESVTSQFQPYGEAKIQQIYAQLTAVPPPPPLPIPNEEERAWLYEVLRAQSDAEELLILETDAWVKKMRAPATREFLALYHQAIEQMSLDELSPASSNTDCRVYWEKNRRVGIAYLYRPDRHRLILLEPLRQSDEPDTIVERYCARLAKIGDSVHELSRIAGRSYPYLMVLDQDAWLAIQKDEEANLALSPEEAELLESIHRTGAGGELGYPLFINGRAGSGKSTMLQYFAADYVNFALRRTATLSPVYMTCSKDLLERARETVRGLLMAHHERLLDGVHEPAQIEEVLRRSFVVFHEFLYSLLTPIERERFAPERFVNYAEFRRLWATDFAKRPEAKKMSPDVAWHTIRSYIKGIRSTLDDELGPEEFAALPRRRRSLSDETFKQVYERVWCSWYKRLCDEGYWDDQDLAASVLAGGYARAASFSAVFCDEAQDFTPLELEIIFQLSAFSKRSLQLEELRRVPIVFAGDPLQTINPTGFRWDAVQADFHERFCAVLDPRRRTKVDVSYRELRFNYRSNPGIVRFCNLIQLIRAALLGGHDAKPQEAWWVDEPAQTVWFATDNAFTKQQLQQRPDLVKLVNCEEGEESTYARLDSVLNSIKEKSEDVFRNVLGPTRAKGLEFPAVVVYRFAETAPSDFLRVLSGEIDVTNDPEKQLSFEYFFNRLYVAASRAKGQLVVVDSAEAFDSFWRFATDPDVVDRLTTQVRDSQAWRDSITYLVRGRDESWSGERIDPRRQGSEYATQGRRKRDPYLLRQAALAYKSASDEIEAGRCLALAAEFEGKLQDAGDRYCGLGFLDDAFRCYWEGGLLKSIRAIAAKDSKFASRLESRAADFVEQSSGIQSAFLSEILKAANEPAWVADVTKDATWRTVLVSLTERLSKAIGDKFHPWSEVLSVLRHLGQQGLPLPEHHIACVAYAAGEHSEAITLWERAGATDRDEYRRAKARVAPFPENVAWFSRLKEHSEVLARWREHRAGVPMLSLLDEVTVRAIVDAALDSGDLTIASELLAVRPERERVGTLLVAAAKQGDGATALSSARMAIRLLVASASWGALVQAAESTDFSDFVKSANGAVRAFLRSGDRAAAVLRAVIEELAGSPELATESPDRQVPLAEFLHRTFIGKGSVVGKHGLTPEVVGAAIERAGKIIDALQYYENLGGDAASSEEMKRFAAERLAKNLERHAIYFRGRGDEKQARERETRAKKAREVAGLGDRQIAEYPTVGTKGGPRAPSEWIRGPFKIVLSRIHGRLRIEHAERFETVTVDAHEKQLRGDAAFSEISSDDACASWRIPAWDMIVKLIITAGGGMKVVALLGTERFEQELIGSERG